MFEGGLELVMHSTSGEFDDTSCCSIGVVYENVTMLECDGAGLAIPALDP